MKKILEYHHIPTPKWDYAYTVDAEIDDELEYPLIVKPANSDNSIGITNDSVVTNKRELRKQIQYVVKDLHSPALVEDYIDGDEYDVSILGNGSSLKVLPLARSIFTNLPKGYWHIFPYESKWDPNSVFKKNIIREMPSKSQNKKLDALITEIALDTYNILDCHGQTLRGLATTTEQ